tara:strand:- start:4923 stop:5519 length:597 start_codon:yes stop_codon:yes gene_type:complete
MIAKNPKADLEKNRFAFFQIGLIVAGSLCLAAFEYSTVQEATMAQFNIDPNTNTILPFDEILQEPSEPQEKKQRVMTEDFIVADPVPATEPEPDPIIDPVIGGGTTIGTIIAPPIIYEVPEIDPSFPGGQAGMAEFINKYIVIPIYMMDDADGTVYISFVVNKNGSIEQSKVIGSVSDALDKAALDVIARIPKWTPGE